MNAFEDGDFQYWNSESVSHEFNEDWKIKVEEELRFGGDAGRFYHHHSDAVITYSGMGDWLELGLNYMLIFEKKENEWVYENRPHLNMTLQYALKGLELTGRNRFEYRDKENGTDGWRYRNRFTVKYPVKAGDFEINPYIADEIFVDFIEEKLNRNRLYAGADFKILKNLKLDIFYLWQASEKDDNWADCNVLGTKVKLSF